jgi:diguanylate cyclase (GGDEF)-like protein
MSETVINLPPSSIPLLEQPAPLSAEESPAMSIDAYSFATVALVALYQAEQERALKELAQHQATHDPLTGLLNRQGMADYLRSNPTPQAVLYLDSTNFKAVNDNISHDRGDQLLIETARILQEATRSTDPIARDGGDEFVIILDNPDRHSGGQLTEDVNRVRQRIEELVHIYLAMPENSDLVEQGYDIAVGVAIRESGLSYNQLKDIAEEDMKAHKARQHQNLGQYRSAVPNE